MTADQRHSEHAAVGFAIAGGLPIDSTAALELGQRAAAAGFSPVLFTEVTGFEAPAMSAAFAATTPDTATGTGIVPLGARSPQAIAMAARTAAALSSEPYYLGVGVSTPQIVEGFHGAAWDASVAATTQRLDQLRAALDGERRGSFAIPQVGRVDVRVLLGAMGPRMLDVGMSHGDGVLANHTPPEHLPEPRPDKTLLAYCWVIGNHDSETYARREVVSYTMAAPYARHFARLGFGEVVEQVHRLHAERRLREAPQVLPAELIDALYVRVENLGDRLAAFRRAGALPVVQAVTGPDAVADAREVIEATARVSRPSTGERT